MNSNSIYQHASPKHFTPKSRMCKSLKTSLQGNEDMNKILKVSVSVTNWFIGRVKPNGTKFSFFVPISTDIFAYIRQLRINFPDEQFIIKPALWIN